jgi:hypothetical protein
MSELKLTIDQAKELHRSTNPAGKKQLEKLFGKDVFLPKITDLVKTFADACKITGDNPVKSLPYAKPANEEQEAINGFAQLSIIRKALNGDWVADWADGNQVKYWPWMKYNPDKNSSSGFRLSYGGYVSGVTHASVGSRLCFKDKETAIYAGTQFASIYEKVFIIKSNNKKSNTKT